MNYYAVTNNTLYLSHYGILGQKWGVRRFQNKDGTRTKLGKVRYGNQNGSTALVKTVDKNGNTTYTAHKKSSGLTAEQKADKAAQKKAGLQYKTENQQKLNEAQVKNQQAIANMTLKREEPSKFGNATKKMVQDALIESGKDILKASLVIVGKYAVGKMLSSVTGNEYFARAMTGVPQQKKEDKKDN